MAFGGRGRTVLDEGATRESVAAECREAALAFVNGVGAGWDKIDLVLWLSGPYARASRHVPRGERVAGLDDSPEITDETIEFLVTRARSQLVASLETAALGEGTLDFVVDAMDRGLVLRALDLDGEAIWVPADNTRMRLRDRVRSLFAADYLNDAAAYAALYVCNRCENVVFDENAKRLGACQNHKRVSGIVPRQGQGEDVEVEIRVAVGEEE